MRTEIWSNQLHEKWKQTKHHVSTDNTLSERYGYRFSNPKSITLIYRNQYADIGSFAQLHGNLTNNPLKFAQEKRVFWSPQHSEFHLDRKFQRERKKKVQNQRKRANNKKARWREKSQNEKEKSAKNKMINWTRSKKPEWVWKFRFQNQMGVFRTKKKEKNQASRKKGNQEDESCCFCQHTYARNWRKHLNRHGIQTSINVYVQI